MTTVLIVDDSKLARLLASKALRQLKPDWNALEAVSAEDAIRVTHEHSIDIALIDYNMPGADGLSLATTLRQTRPDMSIAIVTANIQDEIIAQARAIDVTFVAKPLTAETLSGFLSGAALRLRRQPG